MGRPKSTLQPAASGEFVGTKDAAVILGVSISTVQKMVEAGTLEAWRTQGGHRRISKTSIQREKSRTAEILRVDNTGPLKLLVVEDSALMLKTYEQMFKNWGGQLRVRYASDGASALLALAQDLPDILITDLVMQPFDGRYLIKTIRDNAQLAKLKIVVVTGASPSKGSDSEFDARTLVYRKPLQFERLAGYLDAQVQQLATLRLEIKGDLRD